MSRDAEEAVAEWFKRLIMRRLDDHASDDGKSRLGWRGDSLEGLVAHTRAELHELEDEVSGTDLRGLTNDEAGRVIDEAADLAAMAMMVADVTAIELCRKIFSDEEEDEG